MDPRSRGFTLIELVAAIVIVGAIAAVALPVFRDLRYDARKAALERIRATMVANMTLARTAYLAQGLGAGNTVVVNGRTIEVYAEGASGFGVEMPAGAPTGVGMYHMLGCGAGTPSETVTVYCDGLPGHALWINGPYVAVWPSDLATSYFDAWCAIGYSSEYGFAPNSPLRDPRVSDQYSGTLYGSDYYFYPISDVGVGGC